MPLADVGNRLVGIIDRFNEQLAVRVDEIETFDRTLDTYEFVGIEMQGKTMMGTRAWNKNVQTQAEYYYSYLLHGLDDHHFNFTKAFDASFDEVALINQSDSSRCSRQDDIARSELVVFRQSGDSLRHRPTLQAEI